MPGLIQSSAPSPLRLGLSRGVQVPALWGRLRKLRAEVARGFRAVHLLPLPARVFLAPGMKAWPTESAAAATFRPAGGRFSCTLRQPEPRRASRPCRAARGSGNGEGKRCPPGGAAGWVLPVLPAGCARPQAVGGGFPCRPAPPDSALPAASRAPPQPLSLQARVPQPGTGARLQALLLCPSSNFLVSQSRSSHNRPASFRFHISFCVSLPLVFVVSLSSAFSSAFSGCKQQLLHLGVPPPRA